MYFPTAEIEVSPFVPPLVAFAVSFFTSMGGISGAFLLLPFQMTFLGYTNTSVSATNQLYNVFSNPGGVFRYYREKRMLWPLSWIVMAGAVPGVVIGGLVRINWLADVRPFKLFVALVLLGMTEITAVSTYFITFFDTFGIDLTHWKWLIELCFLVSLVSINLIAVKVFGEVEFWFSMIKITLICAMIATAVVMIVIGYHYPAVQIHGVDHVSPAGHAGFDNLFANFSFAPNGWMAFLMSFQMVFFAYEMIEFVGVTVSETKNPRKVLPKAINEIIVRVLIFYVGALVAIMCIVPWTSFKPNEDGSFASPFIMVFQYAGLNWASALVFFVVITAASSALNSLLYSAGRHLYQLSEVSPNPTLNKLGQVSDRKVPARAILVSAALILLSPIVNAIPGVSGAFVLFSSASSAVFLFIYILTLMAHRKYRRSADFIPDGFVMPAWKVLNTVAIVFFVFIYLTLFLADDTRNSAIAGLVWLVGFGGFSMLRERYRSRDLKAALEHKE